MKPQFHHMFWVLFILFASFSCDIKDNKDVNPADSFLKIYDSQQFDHAIGPIDILQTESGGYLLLGNYRRNDTDFLGTYIASVDVNGRFIRNTYMRDNNVHPAGKLLTLNGLNYFVSMDGVGLQAYLNQVDDSARVVSTISLGVNYPLYAENDGADQFVILSYNSDNQTTQISLTNAEGIIGSPTEFGIGAGQGIDEPIIDHFTRTGRELPFFAGRSASGLYYLNGYYNYTISLLFTDLNNNTPQGVVQGQQDDGGISGLLSLTGGQYAVSRFNFGDNYANAMVDLSTESTTSASDIDSKPMLEWEVDSRVKMANLSLGGSEVVIMAATTKNQQIVMHVYDGTSGEYLAVDYFGFSNPYQLGALEPTSDNGLAILGSTQVAGKFQRLCLFKISEGQLLDLIQ